MAGPRFALMLAMAVLGMLIVVGIVYLVLRRRRRPADAPA